MPRRLPTVLVLGLALAACAPQPTESTPRPPGARPPSAEPTPVEPPAAAPSPDAPFASEADYRRQYGAAVEALEAAAETEATDASSCLTVMHSEQACGGLTDWVVVSAQASDTTRVRELAAEVTALTRRANAQFEWVSTCMAYQAPPVALRDGHCVAVE